MPGEMVPQEHCEAAALKNSDGFGYAYASHGFVQTRRFLNAEQMYSSYLKDFRRNSGSVFLMHWRWATHGIVSVKNSHPFRFKGGAMIHNGVMSPGGLPPKYSDSKYFAEKILSALPEGWEDKPEWTKLIKDAIGYGNKLGLLFNDGRYLIINEAAGKWQGEGQNKTIWYSNDSWRKIATAPPRPTGGFYQSSGWSQSEREAASAAVQGKTWWREKPQMDQEEIDLYRAWYPDEAEECCEVPEGVKVRTDDEFLDAFCDDCLEEIDWASDEPHVCDIPGFVMEQIVMAREDTKEQRSKIIPISSLRRTASRTVVYGEVK